MLTVAELKYPRSSALAVFASESPLATCPLPSLVCFAAMTTPPLRTPTTLNGSPYNPSPVKISYDAYLNYSFSSPTPLPSNARDTPAAISPRQYQLAHLDHGSFSTRPSPPETNSTYHALESDALNAIDASARDLRTFRTLSAAETLLSVQKDTYGESPRKPGSFCFDDDPSHSSSQNSFSTSASFSSYSTRQPSSSQPRTPSRSTYGSSQPRSTFPAASPHAYSQRNSPPSFVFSPFLNYAYPCKSPHTPHRADCSFEPTLDGDDRIAINPFDLGRTPGGFHLHSPLALEEPVATTDISPILRHGETDRVEEVQEKDKGHKQVHGRAFSPDFSDSDEDEVETGLYASSNTACDSPARMLPFIAMSSRSAANLDVQGDQSGIEEVAELQYHETRSLSPTKCFAQDDSSSPPSSLTANEYADQEDTFSSDPISMSSTGYTRIRAARAKANKAIATVFAQTTSGKANQDAPARKESRPRLEIDFDISSPLSSAPSSPKDATTSLHNGIMDLPALAHLSPLSIERPTRAKSRALAAVLHSERDQLKRTTSAGASSSRKRRATTHDTSTSSSARKRAKLSRYVRPQDQTSVKASTNSAMDDDNLEDRPKQRDLGKRTFPAAVPIGPSYPLFYRKFPVIRNQLRYVSS